MWYPKCTEISTKIKPTNTSNATRRWHFNANFSTAHVRLTSPLFFSHVLSFSFALPALWPPHLLLLTDFYDSARGKIRLFPTKVSKRLRVKCAITFLLFLRYKFLSKFDTLMENINIKIKSLFMRVILIYKKKSYPLLINICKKLLRKIEEIHSREM